LSPAEYEQSLADYIEDCLADRRQGYVEEFGEITLRREPLAMGQPSALDQLDQDLADLGVQWDT
jgi:hypothetical protein